MKTTLILPDPLAAQLKREAGHRGMTMSALVEEALRRHLGALATDPAPLPELPRWHGGLRVNVADRNALYDVMDGRSRAGR